MIDLLRSDKYHGMRMDKQPMPPLDYKRWIAESGTGRPTIAYGHN